MIILAYSIPIIAFISCYIGFIAAKNIYLNKEIIEDTHNQPIFKDFDENLAMVQDGYSQAIEGYKLDCLEEDNI